MKEKQPSSLTTARDLYDYLTHLVEVKRSIKYPELSVDKEHDLYHISDAGELKLSLSKKNWEIYQEL